jgi:small subunit ribosomal protein S6
MRQYELALILREQAGKEEAEAKKLVDELLSQIKGKAKDTKILGIRDLAYPIKKVNRGWYGIFVVELPEDKVDELDKAIKLKKEIIRYLLVRVD